MIKHKYVRHSVAGFILWPYNDNLFHKHIGDALRYSDLPRDSKIISAGFAYISPDEVVCNGRS